MTRDGKRDMFWDQPFDEKQASDLCEHTWGVRPQPTKPTVEWGGRRIESASNILFTNGGLDPWSGGGVLKSLGHSLLSLVIPEGAHHLDLMFSNEGDPVSVKNTRRAQEKEVERWILEARGEVEKGGEDVVVAVA
jgi:lysosomal Pro-X carboxypeptidase